ncbi:MAG: multicopper oxidase family protein [Nitrospiraceae bacterium]
MGNKYIPSWRLTRRQMLKLGLAVGGAALLPTGYKGHQRLQAPRAFADGPPPTPFPVTPFSQPLFVPKIMQGGTLSPEPGNYPDPGERFGGRAAGPRDPRGMFSDVAHGIAREFNGDDGALHCDDWNINPGVTHEKEYKLITEETTHRFFPGMNTPVFVYRDAFNASDPGRTPGPTFIARYREPIVVRNENHLINIQPFPDIDPHDIETSIHLHGTHAPAHADGYPDFYVLAREARDYFYPNIAPRVNDGTCGDPFDETWIPSTLWYHDHAMDITGFNVSRGLAGFYLVFDQRELDLITGTGSASQRVLPPPGRAALESLDVGEVTIIDLLGNTGENDDGFDFGLALTDQRFELVDGEARLFYDFLDHNGHLGDVFTVNGTIQPFFNVQQAKYRFRILNASNARIYQLRLNSGQPFLVIGADSWLFPEAHLADSFELAMGQRHDVIVNFSGYDPGTEVFLENIMIQDDGRRGDEVDPNEPTRLLKFIVGDQVPPFVIDIQDGTPIRGRAGVDPGGQWAAITEPEIGPTREFEFDRFGGAWAVNGRFFNPRRADAVPALGTAERWIFENGGGGWWHPIHTHLEGFQIQTLNGRPPPIERQFNSDLVNLHGGEVAEVFIKFRTFTGPFVFHCHNIEHEDMRMMGVHDPRPAGQESPLDGETRIDPAVSGVVPECIELEKQSRILFDAVGDVERLEGRGVGFPECEFDLDRRGNR